MKIPGECQAANCIIHDRIIHDNSIAGRAALPRSRNIPPRGRISQCCVVAAYPVTAERGAETAFGQVVIGISVNLDVYLCLVHPSRIVSDAESPVLNITTEV